MTAVERDRLGAEVVVIRACAREMTAGRLALVEYRIGGAQYFMPSGDCPVHDTRRCLETYYSAPFVASWSPLAWWRWRKTVRRRIGGAW